MEPALVIGDRVKLIAGNLAWRAEKALQGKTGEVIERREDGRITVRYGNGRLLMGREAKTFERIGEIELTAGNMKSV